MMNYAFLWNRLKEHLTDMQSNANNFAQVVATHVLAVTREIEHLPEAQDDTQLQRVSLELNPTDKLIIETDRVLSAQEHKQLTDMIEAGLKSEAKVLLLDNGLKAKIISIPENAGVTDTVEKILQERGCLPDGVQWDADKQILTIDGIPYSRKIFSSIADDANRGKIFQLLKNENGCVHIKTGFTEIEINDPCVCIVNQIIHQLRKILLIPVLIVILNSINSGARKLWWLNEQYSKL